MKKIIAILLLMIIPATASATPGHSGFGGPDMDGLTAIVALGVVAIFVGGISLVVSLSKQDKDPNDPLTQRDNFRKEIKDNSSWMPALNIGPTEDGVYGSMEWNF